MSRVEGIIKGNSFLKFFFFFFFFWIKKIVCGHSVGLSPRGMKTYTFHEMLEKLGGGLNFFLPCEHRGKYYIDFTFISCWWVLFYVCHF